MQNYIDLVERIIFEGEERADRTGVGTLSVFGGHIEWDLRERFPLVTAKETRWRTAFLEMLFFLTGQTNVKWLNERGSKLWDAWADECGELGPVYGSQWRKWEDDIVDIDAAPVSHVDGKMQFTARVTRQYIDQAAELIDGIKGNPRGRRHIVSAWNVADLKDMALPPCHAWHQCYAGGNKWLDMQVYQRSWDIALGAPFNICAYALLLHLYARATGRKPRRLAFCYGDAHIYLNHVEQMRKVAEDGPVPSDNAKLEILTDNTDIDGYTIDDFRITGYSPRGFVAMPVAV